MTPLADLSLLSATVKLVLGLLTISLFFSFFRVVKGPTLADRVVALELIGLLIVGIVVVSAIASDDHALLSVAVTVALIAFLGKIAFAYYLEKRLRK